MKMVFDSILVLDPFLTRKNRFFIQILTKMTSTENLNHTKIKQKIYYSDKNVNGHRNYY